jgi:hypothetical protein
MTKFNLKMYLKANKTKLFCALFVTCWSVGITSICNAELRDPTKPEGFATTTEVNTFTLTATFVSKDNKLAVINGRIMHVGDFLSDVQVISIEENKVVLDGPDGKINLNLLGIPVKHKR